VPLYSYKARDITGKLVTGNINAASQDMAGEKIDSMGYIPVSIREQLMSSPAQLDISELITKKVKSEDLIMFTFQMSTLIGAGIPILTALKTLSKQVENRIIKNIVTQATHDVEQGNTLSDSLEKHPDVFPKLYVNMIRAGELSGTLQDIFVQLGKITEHETETREKIESALRYPKMVAVALIIAFIIVLTFVVPRFVEIFKQFKIALPLPTKMLIVMNTIVQNYWVIILVAISALIVILKIALSTKKGRFYWDYLKIKAPVTGPLFLKSALSQFTHMMGILNKSGLPILDNLKITAESIGNNVISEAIKKIRESIKEGKGLAAPMQELNLFTPLVVQMVAIGEQSGHLDEVLLKVSNYYDSEVKHGIKHLSTYVEPVFTLVLGVMVLFFALAIFMPMWDLTKIAGR